MEKLRERFDAVQDALLTLYENASNDLDTQIQHWELQRQEHVILYFARQNGIRNLGLHHVPSLATSEHKAKEAIMMTLLLKSLKDSPFGNETWSLTETSFEMLNAPPRNCFKKSGYTVDVYYDKDVDKLYPFTGWREIYFQDENNDWHKTSGKVDYYGLYYIDEYGDKIYYVKFDEKAKTLSATGEWEVRYQNKTISPSVSSSFPSSWKPSSGYGLPSTSQYPETTEERGHLEEIIEEQPRSSTNQKASGVRLRRRREGEQGSTRSPKRRRPDTPDSTGSTYPTPAEVGSSTRSVGRGHHTRLERLQIEARDPPVLIVKGCSNTLKCWRFRMKTTNRKLYDFATTVFKWVDGVHEIDDRSRILLAFKDNRQRQLFVDSVALPKGTEVAYGSLNSL
ncbi:E2 [Human papillomavirus 191]|nr:E2 [Human papillomavirus 191]